MKLFPAALAAFIAASLPGCVAPVGPVEVTRFHVPELTKLAQGAIAVEPAPGQDGKSLEFGSYAGAVARQLTLLGYSEAATGSASPQVALVRIERQSYRPDRRRGPVSVGVGGSTGCYCAATACILPGFRCATRGSTSLASNSSERRHTSGCST